MTEGSKLYIPLHITVISATQRGVLKMMKRIMKIIRKRTSFSAFRMRELPHDKFFFTVFDFLHSREERRILFITMTAKGGIVNEKSRYRAYEHPKVDVVAAPHSPISGTK